jgi:hypothetical protein
LREADGRAIGTVRATSGRFFAGVSEGWLEMLEFVCFFRGISFCQNAGAPAARRFAPGEALGLTDLWEISFGKRNPYPSSA